MAYVVELVEDAAHRAAHPPPPRRAPRRLRPGRGARRRAFEHVRRRPGRRPELADRMADAGALAPRDPGRRAACCAPVPSAVRRRPRPRLAAASTHGLAALPAARARLPARRRQRPSPRSTPGEAQAGVLLRPATVAQIERTPTAASACRRRRRSSTRSRRTGLVFRARSTERSSGQASTVPGGAAARGSVAPGRRGPDRSCGGGELPVGLGGVLGPLDGAEHADRRGLVGPRGQAGQHERQAGSARVSSWTRMRVLADVGDVDDAGAALARRATTPRSPSAPKRIGSPCTSWISISLAAVLAGDAPRTRRR